MLTTITFLAVPERVIFLFIQVYFQRDALILPIR